MEKLALRGLEEPAHALRGLEEPFFQLFCCVELVFGSCRNKVFDLLSVCWVCGSGDYDRKKKDTVVCLAGSAVVSVFGSGGKLAVFLLWREILITTRKKKDTVVCLAGAR